MAYTQPAPRRTDKGSTPLAATQFIADSFSSLDTSNVGSVTGPTAGQQIVAITPTVLGLAGSSNAATLGTFILQCNYGFASGTMTAAETNNFKIVIDGTIFCALEAPAAVNLYYATKIVSVTGSQVIAVQAIVLGGGSAVYIAGLTATRIA